MNQVLYSIALLSLSISVLLLTFKVIKLQQLVEHQDQILKVNQRTLDYVYNYFIVGRKQP